MHLLGGGWLGVDPEEQRAYASEQASAAHRHIRTREAIGQPTTLFQFLHHEVWWTTYGYANSKAIDSCIYSPSNGVPIPYN